MIRIGDYAIALMLVFAVVGISTILAFFSSEMIVNIDVKMNDLDIVDATNVLKTCLETEEQDYIDTITLDDVNLRLGFDSYCEDRDYYLSYLSAAKVIDLETVPEKEWKFGNFIENRVGKSHSIFVNIKDGDVVHVGKLYTQVE